MIHRRPNPLPLPIPLDVTSAMHRSTADQRDRGSPNSRDRAYRKNPQNPSLHLEKTVGWAPSMISPPRVLYDTCHLALRTRVLIRNTGRLSRQVSETGNAREASIEIPQR